uniref:Fibronectin n=1 Tax=Ciona intestinalis TaxID=7719 RepID=F6YJ24_CIOIN|nr:fibronectin [Ciona intestinalis]|eukprot:XP_002126304.1 fibronectin [Ciona intestinalis]
MRRLLLVFLFLVTIFASEVKGRCRFRGTYYRSNQRWDFQVGNKNFECRCTRTGSPHCEWSVVRVVVRRCLDSTRRSRELGERWEVQRNNRTLDCACQENPTNHHYQITCSGKNRCHQSGISRQRGDEWTYNDATGLVMRCQCLGRERVTCHANVRKDIPSPTPEAQVVNNYIVYGKTVLRPSLATLQACDNGHRVVTSGFTWNQTRDVTDTQYTIEQCVCRNAIIRCIPYIISRRREPHCLTEDGEVIDVGQSWIKVHQSHENIRWRCVCASHGQRDCRDIGYCPTPTPPINGAIVCVSAGKAGPKQTIFCKPMCLQNYDFHNRHRYYRVWEVCSHVTLHRWSGGYFEDALLLGKCTRPRTPLRGGPQSLYLQTDDCLSLTRDQIHDIEQSFVQSLRLNDLCGTKCQVSLFKCGERSPLPE